MNKGKEFEHQFKISLEKQGFNKNTYVSLKKIIYIIY